MDRDDQEIFNEIYTQYYSLIVKVAYGITGDSTISEEMTQEAFLRYYERMDKLPRNEEARFWLLRVVKNLCYNYRKRQGREGRAYQRYYHEPKNELVNEGEKGLLEEETKVRVQEVLKELPDKLRTVLVMKEYSGLNYKEIGRILNISEGNVKIRVFRARQKICEFLEKGDVHVP